MTLLATAVGLLWIVVIGLTLVILALARQIGILHERIAPVGALTTPGGPPVGGPAPEIVARTLDGRAFPVGGARAGRAAQLLLFVSSACPVCKKIIPIAKSVARAESLELVFVGDAPPEEQRALVKRFELEAYPFLNGPEVGMAFQIGKLPYGVLLGSDGALVAKGLVNNREHLESLAVAKATGFESLQAYLHATQRPKEEA